MRKLNFSVKQYFFPNKRKNLSLSHTDVSIRFDAFHTLGAGATIKKS